MTFFFFERVKDNLFLWCNSRTVATSLSWRIGYFFFQVVLWIVVVVLLLLLFAGHCPWSQSPGQKKNCHFLLVPLALVSGGGKTRFFFFFFFWWVFFHFFFNSFFLSLNSSKRERAIEIGNKRKQTCDLPKQKTHVKNRTLLFVVYSLLIFFVLAFFILFFFFPHVCSIFFLFIFIRLWSRTSSKTLNILEANFARRFMNLNNREAKFAWRMMNFIAWEHTSRDLREIMMSSSWTHHPAMRKLCKMISCWRSAKVMTLHHTCTHTIYSPLLLTIFLSVSPSPHVFIAVCIIAVCKQCF